MGNRTRHPYSPVMAIRGAHSTAAKCLPAPEVIARERVEDIIAGDAEFEARGSSS